MSDHKTLATASRVFKVVPAALWNGALEAGVFHGSADDLRDGYIHLSSAAQVPGTLSKYFQNQNDLLAVAFNTADLAPHLKWETSRGGDLFPHYYGPLPVHLAVGQLPLPLSPNGVPQFDLDQK